MSKKSLIISVVLGAFVLLGAGMLFVFREKESKSNIPTNDQATSVKSEPDSSSQEKDTSLQERDDTTVFVTDVDPDVNHWQTKETEFFTIKFPKEWYWMESDLTKTGYHSQVITNDPNFPIDKYSDIGVFTGGSYQVFSENGKYESIPLNNYEIVITTNGLGDVTSNSGTPREFMEGEIARLKKDLYPEMECHYTSSFTSVPLTAFCSFLDSNGQVVDTYYSSYANRTFAYTARLSQENNLKDTIEHTLEQIAKSLVQKRDRYIHNTIKSN